MPAAKKRRPASAREPRPDAPAARELRLSATDHIKWAKSRARGVRIDYGFEERSHEEEELEGVALVELVRLVERFDESRLPPGGDLGRAFRGWASLAIRSECRRAAEQLRNGGLYVTRQGGPIRAAGLPTNEDGDTIVVDPASIEDRPEWEPAPAVIRAREASPNAVAAPGDTRARFAALRAKLKK